MRDSTKADGRPAMQWYPDDWLEELSLKSCSLAARGLWADLLNRMWKSPERGTLLKANGEIPSVEQIALWESRPLAEVEQALNELQREKVCSTRRDGAIYNRRMVREEEQRLNKVRAGRASGIARGGGTERGTELEQKRGSSSSSPSSSPAPESTDTKGLAQSCASAPSEPDPPCPPELADLELYAKDRRLSLRWPALLPAWRIAYPGVDILAEVRKAHAWELSNPAKRKVHRARFLVNWLSRAQDNGRSSREQPPSSRYTESAAAQDAHYGGDKWAHVKVHKFYDDNKPAPGGGSAAPVSPSKPS